MINKNISLNFLAISLLSGACATAQVEKMPQNSVPPTTLPASVSQTAPISTPTPELFPPTSQDISKVLEYSTDKLGIKNAQITTLDTQPPEIIASVAKSESSSDEFKNLSEWAEKIRLVGGERDLNHDGVPERFIVVISAWGGKIENPNAYIFWMDQGKWIWLTPQMLNEGSDNVEFIPTGKKGEFDIMRYKEKDADMYLFEGIIPADEFEKWKDYIADLKVKDGKYVYYECHLENGKAKKIIPCPKFDE